MNVETRDQLSKPSAKDRQPWQRPEFEVLEIDRHTRASYLTGTDGLVPVTAS